MTQVTNGNAFEYACVISAQKVISEYQSVYVTKDSHYSSCENDFMQLATTSQQDLLRAAELGMRSLIDYEPNLSVDYVSAVTIELNSSRLGQTGDVRDVIIKSVNSNWEIGISAKHNHNAVKHSRLSSSIDFGNEWLRVPTPQSYFTDLNDTWSYLRTQKQAGITWAAIDKDSVYRKVLTAFCSALQEMNNNSYVVPANFMEYLLGRNDYYKLIVLTKERQTVLRAFNMHNTLHAKSLTGRSAKYNSKLPMPTTILKIEYTTNATVNIYFDKGWQISMRIHNASKIVEPSLKFDVQLVGIPTSLLSVVSNW